MARAALLLGRRAALPAAADVPARWRPGLSRHLQRRPPAQAGAAAARAGAAAAASAASPSPGPQYPDGIAWPANVERIEHLPPPDAPGLLRRPALHPERHPRRHGGGRLVALGAAVRGRGLRRADHQRRLAGARRRCSGPGDEILLAETGEAVVRILRDTAGGAAAAIAGAAARAGCWPAHRGGAGARARGASARGSGAPARPCARAGGRRSDVEGRMGKQAHAAAILVTGGAGFIGSHLCEALLARGHRVICLDNFQTGSARQHRPSARGLPASGWSRHDVIRAAAAEPADVDVIYNLACAASPPQYQRDPVHTLKTSVLGRHAPAGARAQRTRGHDPAGLDQRGLWRPGGASAARELLGQRQPDRPARLLRRGQARRRDAVLRLPPHPRRADQGGPDLQHLRAADARGRRPDHLQLRRPGAARRAAHGLWRRPADPLVLLCRRHGAWR